MLAGEAITASQLFMIILIFVLLGILGVGFIIGTKHAFLFINI